MSLSPLPAQRRHQQGDGQLNVTSPSVTLSSACRQSFLTGPAKPQAATALPFHYKVPISVLAHKSYCHNVTGVPHLQQTMGTITIA